MISAKEALDRLREGNRRFVAGTRTGDTFVSHSRRAELAEEQHRYAIILGCSDARVPAEIVFDQGLGDLFVIRVAGNIVSPSQDRRADQRSAIRRMQRLCRVHDHAAEGAALFRPAH